MAVVGLSRNNDTLESVKTAVELGRRAWNQRRVHCAYSAECKYCRPASWLDKP